MSMQTNKAYMRNLESSIASEGVQECFQQPDLDVSGGVHWRWLVLVPISACEVDGWQQSEYQGVCSVLLQAVDAGGTTNVLEKLFRLQRERGGKEKMALLMLLNSWKIKIGCLL